MEIACWNGEKVQVAFALDCHDREAMSHVAAARVLQGNDIRTLMQQAVRSRFGRGRRPEVPIQWLTDNGSIYTALETICAADSLNLVPITTPVSSPQSNGMAEAFVNTLRRDYVDGADLSNAASVLDQLPTWFQDYCAVAPHSALGFKSPLQYRAAQQESGSVT
jgi:putative transposase